MTDYPPTPFTTGQAHALGISSHALELGVRRHQLRRPLRGVYVPAGIADSPALRAEAATLVVSPHSVVCDRSAAWLHGCDVLSYAELDVLPPVEAYVLRGHDPTDRPEVAGGTRDLHRDDWCDLLGLRVTTPLRTAADLGCKLRRREAYTAMNSLARAHGFDAVDLARLVVRYGRRRGVVQLRELAPLLEPRCESPREPWTLLEIVDHGLPAPEPQHGIMVDGRELYRLDFAYPKAMVGVEFDGEEFHSSPEDREADRIRRQWLEDHGWIILVLTAASFVDGALELWIDELRRILEARARAHLNRALRPSQRAGRPN